MTVGAAEARALAAPARQAILRHLAETPSARTVAELTERLGLNHNATRKHLAVLVDAGLVTEEHEVRTVRGRPRLLYRLAAPAPRGYERLAVLLAATLASGRDPVDVARESPVGPVPVRAEPVEALVALLDAEGFDPTVRRRARGADVVLGTCPFADAAAANPEVVCALHRGLAEAAASAIGGLTVTGLTPKDPHRAGCRLAVGPSALD